MGHVLSLSSRSAVGETGLERMAEIKGTTGRCWLRINIMEFDRQRREMWGRRGAGGGDVNGGNVFRAKTPKGGGGGGDAEEEEEEVGE